MNRQALVVAVGIGAAACYSARADAENADASLEGEWVFPSEPCGLDHSMAVGLCREERAVVETPPAERGGDGSHQSGTWSSAAAADTVTVRLDDREIRIAWHPDDESLTLIEPTGCTSSSGFRLGDERLDLGPGWNASWARGICDR